MNSFLPSARRSARRSHTLLLVLGLALFAAPSSAARAAAVAAPFTVQSISVPPGAVWEINRPIEIVFTAPVDFSSVNASTIRIEAAGGVPAAGEFSLRNAQTVRFRAACPTLDDFSDAGLSPDTAYTVVLPGVLDGGATVLSSNGDPLRPGASVAFTTPPIGPGLFFDAVATPPAPVIQSNPGELAACHLELGGGDLVYFLPPIDPTYGASTPAGFLAPLNLYSQPRSRVTVVVQLDQSVSPVSANLGPDRIRLEYEAFPLIWSPLPHELELAANCTQSGSVVRLTPIGILPQNRRVRVVITPAFQDIAGQTNGADVVVGSFTVGTAFDPGTTNPGDGADEVLEEFVLGAADSPSSLEDPDVAFDDPHAVWSDGKLTAAFDFEGTGGPGGDFDWLIPLGQTVILDTTFSVITNAQMTAQQSVINGVVDIRNFTVQSGGTLVIQGPNPCRILVGGTAEIDGRILIKGVSNPGVATLDTTNISEIGSAGQAGGGRGGTGNPLTTQSSPSGGPGFGAFNVPGHGGKGGETAYNPNPDDNKRRPGGGGGGAFGHDVVRPTFPPYPPANPNGCPDQVVIGLDAENGFPGWPTIEQPGNIATGNNGALHPGAQPLGGPHARAPFLDGNPRNDFWGTLKTQAGTLIHGELVEPWAGAGGGGGGNAVHSNSFPLNPFTSTGDEKGAGGGGGGGSFTLLALREIHFGPAGRIDASGGTGGGGENSAGGNITRIGGGSGGGSAGHIVVQSAKRIDLSACRSASGGGIYALGGQGGAGALDTGGAKANGFMTAPHLDALPPNSYPTSSAPCAMSIANGYVQNDTLGNTTASANPLNGNDPNTVVAGAGGDGGPGIIQLHVPVLSDILPPTTPGESLYKCVKPPPIGATSDNVNTVTAWDQMLLTFSRFSRSQSKWIALGAANVDPLSSTPDAPEFLFEGQSGGTLQLELPPILAGTIASAPAKPYIASDQRTIVFDGAALPDDIYTRNPALLRRFHVRLLQGSAASNFEVGSASYDAVTGELFVTVSESGTPLAPFGPGDGVELRPRFFRVSTDGVLDTLDASSAIEIEFQATSETVEGNPNEVIGPAGATNWMTDVALINAHPNAPQFRFVRFRVKFDLEAGVVPLNPVTPVPSLEFLRVPFRF